MVDYILTLLPIIFLGVVFFYDCKYDENGSSFMNKDYTTVLKAVCCIIVIMVHFPIENGNKLQDAIGSFAFVCVTFFFLFSAYGMNFSKAKKANYIDHFWRNRLAALLIPALLVNITALALTPPRQDIVNQLITKLIHVNGYVMVLLQYCLFFWLVCIIGNKVRFVKRHTDTILMCGVILSSLFMYFTVYAEVSSQSGWCFERMGLVWGIVIFLYLDKIRRKINPTKFKMIVSLFISLVLGIAYLRYKGVFFWGEYLLKIILGVSIITSVFICLYKLKLGNRVIFYLGSISYEVYLLHGIVIGFLNRNTQDLSSGLFICLTIAITIILSALIHHIGQPIIKRIRV